MSSALLSKPPLNDNDYWIARGMKLRFGAPNPTNVSKGVPIGPHRPPPSLYHHETQTHQYIALGTVCICLMLLSTGTRLIIRAREWKLRLGWDDGLILLATVWFLLCGTVAVGC